MSLQTLLNQSATIYPKSGYNKFGRDVSGSGVSAKCRFENKTRTRMLPDQQLIQLIGNAFFAGTVSINTDDRITIGGVNYKVFSVNGSIDGHGTQRVVKCELTKWQM